MSNTITPITSEPVYKGLDPETATVLQRITKIIRKSKRTIVEEIIRVGEELATAQSLLAGKGREGLFRPWFRECCGLSKSDVYRALAAYEAFGKCPTVGHFDARAIYLLSSNSCPGEATQEAITLAEGGEYIDYGRAKNIAAKYVSDDDSEPAADGDQPDQEENNAVDSGANQSSSGNGVASLVSTPVADDSSRAKDITAKHASNDNPKPAADGDQPNDEENYAVVSHANNNSNGGDTAPVVFATVVDPVMVSAAMLEPPAANDGVIGLQAVVSALKRIGVYGDYEDVLEQIRLALEQNPSEQDGPHDDGSEEVREKVDEWEY